jgi:hypothetical protein
MKAKFIGKDHSMGFINGKIYDLCTECKIVNGTAYLCVYDNNSDKWCPYSKLETMLQNWELE